MKESEGSHSSSFGSKSDLSLGGDLSLGSSPDPDYIKERHFREDVSGWLVVNSLGLDPSRLWLHRYIPTKIYVDTMKQQRGESDEIATAFDELLGAAEFETFEDFHPI